ncbi:hypothetical protein [Paenibacillus cremeus]|uniref:Uncharacterized protein n=1 Tax=Paenibacillus cremeus TaxID=2163881 RepID=A0A559K899_9BACL|nr:hypothetical protein [Paenibacillus cremeus]TVY08352.1 hypothetical protein FPZ49_19085 [Paenibacillus cremeus]
MILKTCSPTAKICAMCSFWNGQAGGTQVKPKSGMMNFFEYDSEEKNICYNNHFIKKAWNSCGHWKKRY